MCVFDAASVRLPLPLPFCLTRPSRISRCLPCLSPDGYLHAYISFLGAAATGSSEALSAPSRADTAATLASWGLGYDAVYGDADEEQAVEPVDEAPQHWTGDTPFSGGPSQPAAAVAATAPVERGAMQSGFPPHDPSPMAAPDADPRRAAETVGRESPGGSARSPPAASYGGSPGRVASLGAASPRTASPSAASGGGTPSSAPRGAALASPPAGTIVTLSDQRARPRVTLLSPAAVGGSGSMRDLGATPRRVVREEAAGSPTTNSGSPGRPGVATAATTAGAAVPAALGAEHAIPPAPIEPLPTALQSDTAVSSTALVAAAPPAPALPEYLPSPSSPDESPPDVAPPSASPDTAGVPTELPPTTIPPSELPAAPMAVDVLLDTSDTLAAEPMLSVAADAAPAAPPPVAPEPLHRAMLRAADAAIAGGTIPTPADPAGNSTTAQQQPAPPPPHITHVPSMFSLKGQSQSDAAGPANGADGERAAGSLPTYSIDRTPPGVFLLLLSSQVCARNRVTHSPCWAHLRPRHPARRRPPSTSSRLRPAASPSRRPSSTRALPPQSCGP